MRLRRTFSLPALAVGAWGLSVGAVALVAVSARSPAASAAFVLLLLAGLAARRQYIRACEGVRDLADRIEKEATLPTVSGGLRGPASLGALGASLQDLLDKTLSARKEVASSSLETVKTIALAMEARDPYTQGHCLRVRYLTRRILDFLDVSPDFRHVAETAALLHDVGKIGVPDAVLFKKGKLTPEEYARVMLHVQIGVEILGPLSSMREVCTIVRHHHERVDGKGYPDGIAGESIPLASRIIAAADTVDAMRSTRPYRPALGLEAILKELRRCRGTQLDSRIADIVAQVLQGGRRKDAETAAAEAAGLLAESTEVITSRPMGTLVAENDAVPVKDTVASGIPSSPNDE